MTPSTASLAPYIHAIRKRSAWRASSSSPAISTSTASAPEPWWERIPSAGLICRAPTPRPAAPITCCNSCRPSRSPNGCKIKDAEDQNQFDRIKETANETMLIVRRARPRGSGLRPNAQNGGGAEPGGRGQLAGSLVRDSRGQSAVELDRDAERR